MRGMPISFTTNSFIIDAASGKQKMLLTADDIGFDGSQQIRLSKLLRQVNGKLENVIAAYDVDTNGNMQIYSDVPFNGELVITTDE